MRKMNRPRFDLDELLANRLDGRKPEPVAPLKRPAGWPPFLPQAMAFSVGVLVATLFFNGKISTIREQHDAIKRQHAKLAADLEQSQRNFEAIRKNHEAISENHETIKRRMVSYGKLGTYNPDPRPVEVSPQILQPVVVPQSVSVVASPSMSVRRSRRARHQQSVIRQQVVPVQHQQFVVPVAQ